MTDLGQASLPEAEAVEVIRVGAAALARSSRHPMDVVREIAADYAAGKWRDQYASWAEFLKYEYGIRQKPTSPGRADDRTVYFIQAVQGGPIKIGVAEDVDARLSALQTGSPLPLRVLAILPSSGRYGEAQLHQRFAATRLHGEWFEATPELLAFIAEPGEVATRWGTGSGAASPSSRGDA
jgi:hypothetical protein